MNVYCFSFFDLVEARMVSGLMVAICRESVLTTIAANGYKAVCVTVRAMPALQAAIEMDCEGQYDLDPGKVLELSHELLIRKGGGDL